MFVSPFFCSSTLTDAKVNKITKQKYFYIPHYKESRGIGGIFFNDLCAEPHVLLVGDKETPHPRDRPHMPDELFMS
jgi:coproporphyrinogen III oxidase